MCCSVGAGAWVQQGARVMPGVVMEAGARLLPGSTVLPGEVLRKGTLWGGGVPSSPLGRCVQGVLLLGLAHCAHACDAAPGQDNYGLPVQPALMLHGAGRSLRGLRRPQRRLTRLPQEGGQQQEPAGAAGVAYFTWTVYMAFMGLN